jgi:hypothetical protein
MLTESNRWDFVTRTFQMLIATVNPRNPSGEAFMVFLLDAKSDIQC